MAQAVYHLARAYGRKIGTEVWTPITQFGNVYYGTLTVLEALITAMRLRFPDIEYKIVEEEDAN